MKTDALEYEQQLKQLKKENRILAKKLQRSQERQVLLEQTNQKKESLLKGVIQDLEESRDILEYRTIELSETLAKLQTTQKQLVESEKMAALGGLVAGVAHEINTPLGTSITVASTLKDETKLFLAQVEQGQLKRSTLNNYLSVAQESSELIVNNLYRAGELVQSFKQVAVDQTSQERRSFQIKEYLEEILLNLKPKFKQTKHTVKIIGDENLKIDSYPGAFAQVITNLIINSLVHAYQPEEAGNMQLELIEQPELLLIKYSDDGCGIPPESLKKIFEPFFTTARDRGGTGLGMHLVYNLVVQQLQGHITVESEVDRYTVFKITLPYQIT